MWFIFYKCKWFISATTFLTWCMENWSMIRNCHAIWLTFAKTLPSPFSQSTTKHISCFLVYLLINTPTHFQILLASPKTPITESSVWLSLTKFRILGSGWKSTSFHVNLFSEVAFGWIWSYKFQIHYNKFIEVVLLSSF